MNRIDFSAVAILLLIKETIIYLCLIFISDNKFYIEWCEAR